VTPSRLIAAGFGSGFSPKAPGTAGSLLGLLVGCALLAVSPGALAVFVILVTLVGTFSICRATGFALTSGETGPDHDPGWIVIDEIAGQCLALLALPRPSLAGAALAFAAFRLFDIAKPGPVGWADRQGGAVGIMLDDVLAGGLAGICVALAHELFAGIV